MGRSSLADMTEVLVKDSRALKHVQVREYVRSLVSGMAPGSPAPSERELVAPVRRRPDDRAPGDGRAGRRGAARADPRQGHVRGPPAPYRELDHQLHRGDDPPRPARRVARPCWPAASRPAPASPGRSTSPRATRSSTGSGCAAPTAPRCASRTPTSTRCCCPGFLQSGMPTSLYDALEQRGLRPTWAEDSVTADVCHRRRGRAAWRSTPGAVVLRHSRRALHRRQGRRGVAQRLPRRPVHPLGAARARTTRPSAGQRLAPSGADHVAGLLAHPHRVRAAEVGLDVERVLRSRRSRGTAATGRRCSNSASCTSWATSPATYTWPSGHWSAHHSRADTASSRMRDRLRASRGRGPGGRRARALARRTAAGVHPSIVCRRW